MDTIGKVIKDSDFNDLGMNLNKYIPKTYSNNVPGETLKKFFANTALNDVFADKLKFYMKANDITGKTLAQKIGVTEGAVNKWANGIRFPKDEHRIINITNILGITIADIMPDTLRQRELITKQELSLNWDKYLTKDSQNRVVQDYDNSVFINGDNHNNHKINTSKTNLSAKEQILLEFYREAEPQTQKDVFSLLLSKKD